MQLNAPLVLHDGADEAANGESHYDPQHYLNDRIRNKAILEVVEDSDPTFSLQPQQSIDGETWYPIGEAITEGGLSVLTVDAPYFRANLASISTGTVTVKVR